MDESNKEVQEMRANDLSPAQMEAAQRPKKTWFFERMGDGTIIATEAREAWDICYNKSSWKRRDFKLLGTSDGTTYNRIVKESMKEAHKIAPSIEQKKEELEKYMRAEEKLLIDEAVDMEGDPEDEVNENNKKKVLRIRNIMDRLHSELDKLEAEYNSFTSGVVQKATDAELEVAKADQKRRIEAGEELDWPDQNMNIQTPEAKGGRRSKIVSLIGQRAE